MCYVPLPNHMALLLLALLILIAAIYEQQGCPMDSVYGKVLKDKHRYMATIAALFRLCFLWCWCRSMGRSWVEREREQRGSVCQQSPQRTTGRGPQQLWSFLNKVTTAVELLKQSDHRVFFYKVNTAVEFSNKVNTAVEFLNKVKTAVDLLNKVKAAVDLLKRVNTAVELFEQKSTQLWSFLNNVNTAVDLLNKNKRSCGDF